jgi:hypothetical protein
VRRKFEDEAAINQLAFNLGVPLNLSNLEVINHDFDFRLLCFDALNRGRVKAGSLKL